jgi:hypothetical protein
MSKNSPGLIKLRNTPAVVLFDLYWNKGYSHEQIARKFKVSSTAVKNLYSKHKIKSRTNAESQMAINIHRGKKLSFLQEQLIYGSLLGDACLSHQFFHSNKTGKLLESYKLCFYHSNKFKDYVLHKRVILGKGSKTKKLYKLNYRVSGLGSLMVGFSFCHSPTLKEVAKQCLDTNYKKSITTEWLEKIDWPGITYWYQDDGSLQLNKKGHRTLSFHTESYKKKEIVLLQKLLLKFGLTTTLGINNKNSAQQVILAHRKKEINKFIENIKPYVIPCMLYKIRTSGLFREKKDA